jgi:peptidoglycan/xylan/chitin deacetylase (PgdA/CDA1 family)
VSEAVVLCYHAVSPTWTATLSVTPDALERQLSLLLRSGWRATTFTEAVLDPPARRTLAVTFDDAFSSVRTLAQPILASLGIPATVFAPTAFMSERRPLQWPGIEQWLDTPDVSELICMDWGELGELSDLGWEIGSHTRTHPRLTALDEKALGEELAISMQECAGHLGGPCRSIAYPYGDVDQRVAERARDVGYRVGAGLSSSLKPLGVHRCPRIGIYHGDVDRRFRLKMHPLMRRWRASQLWPRAG